MVNQKTDFAKYNPADPFGLVAKRAAGVNIDLPHAKTNEIAPLVVPEVVSEAVASIPIVPEAKTKTQAVIDYLKAHGTTDTHTLRGVLGIKGKALHPLNYLQHPMADGRIKREKELWWAPGYEQVEFPPAVAETTADIRRQLVSQLKHLEQSAIETALVVMHNRPAAVAEKPVIVAEIMPPVVEAKPGEQTTILDDGEIHGYPNMPRQLVEEVREIAREQWEGLSRAVAQRYPTTTADREEAPDFVVALLSNSNLEIRQDGKTVTLKKVEWTHMREFINKVEMA